MSRKSKIRDHLESLQPVPGILPTRVAKSDLLHSVAVNLSQKDSEAALSNSREQLTSQEIGSSITEPVTNLYDDEDIHEQLAGFADAGINFFRGDDMFLNMSNADRGERGGNSMVARVFLRDKRLMLETSRIIVRFEEGVSNDIREEILGQHSTVQLGYGGLPPRTIRADVGDGIALEVCLRLMDSDAIVYAEPDFVEHLGQRLTPNDPEFAQQWHHQNISSQDAWDITQGDGVRIAVIDNGFDVNHPDLRFGSASGWFKDNMNFSDAHFVPNTTGMPDENHGTACAGMIAAIADNIRGGCGVAFNSHLSMIACLSDQIGPQSTLARAISYAANPALEGSSAPGADIISCSLGPNGANWNMTGVLEDAIDFASSQGRSGLGCAIFWACTNGNHPISFDKVCSHPKVIATGRSTQGDADNGSGFGPKLEFLAPGVDVWIPASGGGYHSTTGTSFAAPCAAGVAGLALSVNRSLTATELRTLLRESCDKVGQLPYINDRNDIYGHGRVNSEKAVSAALAAHAIM